MLPSTIGSSTPVTVTVCVTFQFAVVNVRLAGATVPSVRSELVNPTVTFAVGWLVRTTVNVAVPPASVVVSPDVGFTVIPATSLSVFVTDTSAALKMMQLPSGLSARADTILYAMLPSSITSRTPLPLTVCATFQFAVVTVSEAGATVPSFILIDAAPTEISPLALHDALPINVAVPPASVVVSPDVGFTVIPATSLSVFVTDTSDAFRLLYLPSVLVAGAVTMV